VIKLAALSLLFSIILSELLLKLISDHNLLNQLGILLKNFSNLRLARDDDERQDLMIYLGKNLLSLSVTVFLKLALILAVLILPLVLIDWNELSQLLYLIMVSVISICWIFLRKLFGFYED
jgi:hypothetical protein